MKYTEIPKFTQTPPYHVNVTLDYFEKWLEDYQNMGVQLNPDFQRGHVWTEKQQIAYVEYILQNGTSGKEFYFNHTNGLLSISRRPYEFVCVDGLQRITAILKFLHNKIPAFGTLCKDFEDRLRMSNVTFNVYVNNLKTKKLVLKWYLEMNSGGTPHTQEELDKVREMLKDN